MYLFLGWLFDIGAGVCHRATTWWIGLPVGYWLVVSVLFNAGALYRRESEGGDGPVQLSKVCGTSICILLCVVVITFETPFISLISFLDAIKKRKRGPKGVQSLVKR